MILMLYEVLGSSHVRSWLFKTPAGSSIDVGKFRLGSGSGPNREGRPMISDLPVGSSAPPVQIPAATLDNTRGSLGYPAPKDITT